MPSYGHRPLSFTIANAANLSDAQQLNGLHGEGLVMPAAWTAATLGFAVSDTLAGTYLPLVDAAGVEVAINVAASQAIVLPMGLLRGWNFVKLQSGTSAVHVNQGGQRIVQMLARAYE